MSIYIFTLQFLYSPRDVFIFPPLPHPTLSLPHLTPQSSSVYPTNAGYLELILPHFIPLFIPPFTVSHATSQRLVKLLNSQEKTKENHNQDMF